LPSEPKIFHGRETEVSNILQLLMQEAPRISILGLGGIGKTSLARAILHHPQVTARYEQQRFFVPCDSTVTKAELAALIGIHLELKLQGDPVSSVIRHFTSNPECLLVLDNFETIWEPLETRGDIEEFLSLL
ncbi:hypothetical protein C8R43DRAFT_820438, partial [Mycena crocata]